MSDNPFVGSWTYRSLLNDPDVGGMRIDVDTFKGVVTLSGRVKSQAEKDQALAVARRIEHRRAGGIMHGVRFVCAEPDDNAGDPNDGEQRLLVRRIPIRVEQIVKLLTANGKPNRRIRPVDETPPLGIIAILFRARVGKAYDIFERVEDGNILSLARLLQNVVVRRVRHRVKRKL